LECSVDDIVQEAKVSRQTFYRHFEGKLGIGLAYFEEINQDWAASWDGILDQDFSDRATVALWITKIFDEYKVNREIFQVFFEMSVVEPKFRDESKSLVPSAIERFGEKIPAFTAMRGKTKKARQLWIEAWLFLWHLREQSFFFAGGFMERDRDLVINSFTETFLRIVNSV
jgi:AcrR family transcriptional regulator